MSLMALLIPLSAVLAIILLSVGVRPRHVVAVWAAIVVLATAVTMISGGESDAAASAAPSVAAPAEPPAATATAPRGA